MFYQLSQEFGWTPDEIRHLTLQEFDHYIVLSHQHRDAIHPTDCSAEAIRQMLSAFFGISPPQAASETEATIERVAKAHVSKDEKDAWIAAGMPSPFESWLANYRKGLKDESRRAGG